MLNEKLTQVKSQTQDPGRFPQGTSAWPLPNPNETSRLSPISAPNLEESKESHKINSHDPANETAPDELHPHPHVAKDHVKSDREGWRDATEEKPYNVNSPLTIADNKLI